MPLRSDEHLLGLPVLGIADRFKVREANRLRRQLFKLLELSSTYGVKIILENPRRVSLVVVSENKAVHAST